MSNIKVSYSEIEQSATQLGNGRDDITTKLQDMQRQISGLVSSGFVTDQASVKFNDAYTQYTTSAMREMDAQIAAKIN